VTVHLVPPVPQREAIGYMLGADLLLLPQVESIVPSKALQYLRAARPLLALMDAGGGIRDLLQDMPEAYLVDRGDAARAGALIAALAAGPRPTAREPGAAVRAYSRREIARRYAAVLDGVRERAVLSRPAPSRPLDFGSEPEQRVLRSHE
jgi:glycosyltransferase involved in cell wall biosynthesis